MQNVTEKIKKIKLVLMDVDGVLTNGIIYFADNGVQMKGYHVHDGIGIKLLHKNNIQTGVISAKNCDGLRKRVTELGMKYIFLGHENKLPIYEKIKNESGYTDAEIAYIGDDLPDLPILTRVGLAITVPQAPDVIKSKVDVVTDKKGGKGAVREVCEFILDAKGLLQPSIETYVKG